MTPRAVWLALTLIVSISPAHAHEAIGGAGPFVNGLLHPAIEPAHLLSLLALGLWIARLDRDALRRSILAFATALIAGLLAGSLGILPAMVPLAVALILGCLVAGGWHWPASLAAMVSVAAAAARDATASSNGDLYRVSEVSSASVAGATGACGVAGGV